MAEPQPVDLTNCDREPIHIPGSIQPHGALLALDTTLSVVLRHSANTHDLLALPRDLNGKKVEDVLGSKLAHDLRNAVAIAGDESRASLILGQSLPSGMKVDISVHRHRSIVIVEFEAAAPDGQPPLQMARSMIGRIAKIETQEALVLTAARLIRATLGYDRVMIYRFERDGSGKVLSEAKRPDLESFLGQYFPAADIPVQARALYLKNTIRTISDSSFTPVPLVPVFDLSGEPLDLSLAHLRSVSPIHCEYLRNMGVGASMSISIIIDGQLWGLVACHHYSPRVLPMGLRVAAEMFGEFLSLQLNAVRHRLKLITATRAREHLDRILQLSGSVDVADILADNLQEFGKLIPNTGFGLYLAGQWTSFGITPPLDEIPALVRFVGAVSDGQVWATDSIVRHFPPAGAYHEGAAGLLAIPLSQLPRDYILFFRKELVQTLDWAGDPEKSYISGPLGDRLTPRTSFAIWKQTVHRQAKAWADDERDLAEAVRAALVEVVLRHSELRAEERSKAEVRQKMLNQELNHRVKNILSVIKALVGQPVQDGRSLRDYVATLRGRIQALARAHDQVIRGDGGGALLELLDAELSPYRSETTTLNLQGPSLWLDARAYSVMALVLHELATNAAKYGALSTAGGSLSVDWEKIAGGDYQITWREHGGPEVLPPSREGFGTALLDRSVPFDLGGESKLTYAPSGLEAWFRLPGRHLRVWSPSVGQDTMKTPLVARKSGSLPADLSIVLLEDQMLIALDVEQMLNDRGLFFVTTTNSVAEALKVLELTTPDVVILDVNLGTGTSIPVAEELVRKGVPFVFATGYGDGGIIAADYASIPLVRKPYDADALVSAIEQAIAGKRQRLTAVELVR